MLPVLAATPNATDWLTAGGGIAAAVTAIVLAAVAVVQMRATRRQADAAADQLQLMREEAERERTERVEESRRLEAEQAHRDAAVSEQIEALREIAAVTLNAARAQVQPVVLLTPAGGTARGPDDHYGISATQFVFPYLLRNEGTGTALNVAHGIEIEGKRYPFGGGMQFAAFRPNERLGGSGTLHVAVDERVLPPDWSSQPTRYWARFESVFGDVFETRSSSDPAERISLVRIEPSL